jgi:hypothetical protein
MGAAIARPTLCSRRRGARSDRRHRRVYPRRQPHRRWPPEPRYRLGGPTRPYGILRWSLAGPRGIMMEMWNEQPPPRQPQIVTNGWTEAAVPSRGVARFSVAARSSVTFGGKSADRRPPRCLPPWGPVHNQIAFPFPRLPATARLARVGRCSCRIRFARSGSVVVADLQGTSLHADEQRGGERGGMPAHLVRNIA